MAKKTARKKKRRFSWKLRIALLLLFCAFIVCVVYGVWASTFDLKEVESIPERSAVYDMDGRYYTRLAGENRVTVDSLRDVSRDFRNARRSGKVLRPRSFFAVRHAELRFIPPRVDFFRI